MDNIYNGEQCPVCHARFFEDDDIVYCPVCGAPHHRECWKLTGHCAFEDKHGTPEQWHKAQENCAASAGAADAHPSGQSRPNINDNICPTCHKQIPVNSLFCPYCGHDFVSGEDRNAPTAGQPQMFGTPFTVNVDPLGGVNEREEIDGIPVRKVAKLVGSNSRRYIPIFAAKTPEGKPKKIGWNWAAFLIPQYWMVYRKSYIASVFAFVASLMANLCLTPFLTTLNTLISEETAITYRQLITAVAGNMDKFSYASCYLAFAALFIMLAVRVVYALFGDYFYRQHCVNTIKDIEEKFDSDSIDQAYLRKGNVNPISPVLAYMLFNVAEMLIAGLI